MNKPLKPNRRSFLGMLGIGTAAGPLAAKEAFDADVIAKSRLQGMISNPGFGVGLGGISTSSMHESLGRARAFKQLNGLPEWVEEAYRERSKGIYALDPDLAVKRSWSMAAKIYTQRERNYQAYVNSIDKELFFETAKRKLAAALGFQWPYL